MAPKASRVPLVLVVGVIALLIFISTTMSVVFTQKTQDAFLENLKEQQRLVEETASIAHESGVSVISESVFDQPRSETQQISPRSKFEGKALSPNGKRKDKDAMVARYNKRLRDVSQLPRSKSSQVIIRSVGEGGRRLKSVIRDRLYQNSYCEGFGESSHTFWGVEAPRSLQGLSVDTQQRDMRTQAFTSAHVDFTYATQSSYSRLWMLPHLCSRWSGDIIVTVARSTIPEDVLNSLLANVKHLLPKDLLPRSCRRGNLFIHTPQGTAVNRDVRVFLTDPTPDFLWPGGEYGINQMRNAALCRVRTSHALYSDIDFWPSSDLYSHLRDTSRRSPQPFLSPDHALIIPAFTRNEFKGSLEADACDPLLPSRDSNCTAVGESMPHDLPELKQCVKTQRCNMFDSRNADGHGTTNFRRWSLSRRGQLLPVPCFQSWRFEPYLVLPMVSSTPPFQESFRGYGKNKIEHSQHLRYANFKFSVLAKGFLTHFPHRTSSFKKLWDKDRSRVRMSDRIFGAQMDALEDVYGPNTTQSTPFCKTAASPIVKEVDSTDIEHLFSTTSQDLKIRRAVVEK